ncbi:carboxypeptidase-like regulatory domain-containing protein [Flavobacterium sp. 3HN19-14]|uniref:STN domain-containing protein n=1 Tax=Flavobacterium sp. 3HN19-14 TaxID=3448133 RepID=UPI003EE036B4
MKLTVLLLFLALFNIRANTYAQTIVSLDLKNATVEEVIEKIEQSSDFRFIYKMDDVDINRVVSIRVKDETINNILEKLFKSTATEYKVRDTQIILKKAMAAEKIIPDILVQKSIKGKVTDEKGLPLPGATVMEEATKKTVVTDIDGNFEIAVSGNDAVLLITYIGYLPKRIPAGDNLSIQLLTDPSDLQEVVVIGYGSSAKRDVTGAIGSITAKDMNQGALVNPLQLISGKLAGVSINQTGSEQDLLRDQDPWHYFAYRRKRPACCC